jgi:hypothetical protein
VKLLIAFLVGVFLLSLRGRPAASASRLGLVAAVAVVSLLVTSYRFV